MVFRLFFVILCLVTLEATLFLACRETKLT